MDENQIRAGREFLRDLRARPGLEIGAIVHPPSGMKAGYFVGPDGTVQFGSLGDYHAVSADYRDRMDR